MIATFPLTPALSLRERETVMPPSATIDVDPNVRDGLAPMPFGNSANRVSRRDIVSIARRFNAGNDGPEDPVPKGRLKSCVEVEAVGDSTVPSGLDAVASCHPALKRWAIVGCPSGTNIRTNSRKASGLARICHSPAGRGERYGGGVPAYEICGLGFSLSPGERGNAAFERRPISPLRSVLLPS